MADRFRSSPNCTDVLATVLHDSQGNLCPPGLNINGALSPSGVVAGSYTNTDLTVNANGIITAATNGSSSSAVVVAGSGSNAMRYLTATASGANSIALGHQSLANNTNAAVLGANATASGDFSTCVGVGSIVSASSSACLGSSLTQTIANSVICGAGSTFERWEPIGTVAQTASNTEAVTINTSQFKISMFTDLAGGSSATFTLTNNRLSTACGLIMSVQGISNDTWPLIVGYSSGGLSGSTSVTVRNPGTLDAPATITVHGRINHGN